MSGAEFFLRVGDKHRQFFRHITAIAVIHPPRTMDDPVAQYFYPLAALQIGREAGAPNIGKAEAFQCACCRARLRWVLHAPRSRVLSADFEAWAEMTECVDFAE